MSEGSGERAGRLKQAYQDLAGIGNTPTKCEELREATKKQRPVHPRKTGGLRRELNRKDPGDLAVPSKK